VRFVTPPTRLESVLAYMLSALTTLVWVGCVMPGGELAGVGWDSDAATPMHRAPIILVPALLLLTILPVGFTLSRRKTGLLSVLASTDAFVALYAALAFGFSQKPTDAAGLVCLGLLTLLGALSVLEAYRGMRLARRGQEDGDLPRWLRGMRLAICILVLVVPSRFLLQGTDERASWLGPFVFIAISAAGAQLARTGRGLRRTAGVLQLALAIHVVITLRWTLMDQFPTPTQLTLSGHITLLVAGVAAGVALAQLLALMRGLRTPAPTPVN
jgi:hypothetical protein